MLQLICIGSVIIILFTIAVLGFQSFKNWLFGEGDKPRI